MTINPGRVLRGLALSISCAALGSTGFGSVDVAAQQAQSRSQSEALELHVLPLRGNVYLLHGAGANITMSIGREGVLLVDAGTAAMGNRVVAAVQELVRQVISAPTTVKSCVGITCNGPAFSSYLATIASPAPAPPIRYIVNTNADPDHTGGNARIAQAGTTLGIGPGLGAFQAIVKAAATTYAHETVLRRLSDAKVPSAGWPTETYTDDFKQYLNGEGIQLIHLKAAHTDGDTVVHFRGSDIISTGDIFSTVTYPVIDLARGGSINGVIDGLNRLLDLVIPEYQTEGGTLLVPGHGRVCDVADLATYRDGMTIIRDRIQTLIGRGMSLAQIKASGVTKDYDTRYDKPEWTRDAFVEAVYQSLTAAKR